MHSYFDTNSERVRANVAIPQSEHGPTVSFLTITDFSNLLFGDNTNLAKGITGDFMHDVMRVDFNKVINSLRSYSGTQRKGIREAQTNVDEALQSLYTAMEEDQKHNTAKKVKALRNCRSKLEAAHHHLEHWK